MYRPGQVKYDMGMYILRAIITLAICIVSSSMLVLVLFSLNHCDVKKTEACIHKFRKNAGGKLKIMGDILIDLMNASYKEDNRWNRKDDGEVKTSNPLK